MNTSSLAGHAIELTDSIVKSTLPADKIISDFYRQRRYIGSHDRRWITDKIYDIIRNFIFLREISKGCSEFGKVGDAMVIFLIHEIRLAEMNADEIKNSYSQLLDVYEMSGKKIDVENLVTCANDVATKLISDPVNHLIMNSFPDFFCEFLPQPVREECDYIMTALNHEARVCVRVDTEKISREHAMDILKENGAELSVAKYSPFGIYLSRRINLNTVDLYKNGSIEVQDEASQLVGLIVNPQEGETIVDACAGAGGKSLEFAALSKGKSKIVALDVDEVRLSNLRIRAMRSGYENIRVMKIGIDDFAGVDKMLGVADKVIVDAPCTGSGTIRRNPEKKFRLSKQSVDKAAAYQKKLLKHYSELVKVGGFISYVTCSIFEEENQAVIDYFLGSVQNFKKIDVSTLLIDTKFAGMIEDGFLMIYPHRYDMDGFFVAVMERVM